tara:strand:- start:213 stop:521 length:309 start_codon:yes stop_codon:yes gene_type:complete
MFRKILLTLIMILFVTSCADTFDSVKRGLTGAKSDSADEFLVRKKDPLILPPDYENLPVPEEGRTDTDEISIFEKSFEISPEDDSTTSGSVESSILKKIQSK